MRKAIGIDLGGTRIKGVVLDESRNILQQAYLPTYNDDGISWKTAVADTISQLREACGAENVVVGISAPGIANADNASIAYMPGRLQGLENFVWSQHLQTPAWVLNDAVSALLAEARLGAAQRVKNAVLLTLGTGVGGAVLINGSPYQGAFHKAGHLGHLSVDCDGEQGITGIPGSLEDAIGNCTVQKRTLGKYTSTQQLLDACDSGDHFAQWVWLSSVRKLAIGIASLTNILSPECVVIGGGIAEAGSKLFDPLESFLSLYEWRTSRNRAAIVKAACGDLAGSIGAACFALEQHSKSTDR